ncbi:helix-turn-helix transcriptional regulator [Actinopolymorpha sp. B17G11]|uniref:helix-turn-helix transcriptional regulator n=1 Tax=unclassified Actinopolymorpha TaxID=2627063 RepID=UPI0032D903F0
MPKLSKMRSAQQIRAEDLRDAEVRAEYDRTALAHAVAMRVIKYRIDHGLSQTALGRQLGMAQPAVARLEAGEHEPSLETLSRLARGLGVEFHIDITPDALGLRETA